MSELKPCPFCGGEAKLVSDYSSEKDQMFWSVYHFCIDGAAKGELHGYGTCDTTSIETAWQTKKQRAIKAWNRRAK
jgi:Lar family restriction alleviation protein